MKSFILRGFGLNAAVLLLASPPATAQLGTGLVGHWPLDGNLLDSSPTGAHGTFAPGSGDPTLRFGTGQFGQGIDLNNFNAGSFDQYIDITGAPEDTFDFTGGSMSFSLWAKSEFIGFANQAMLAKGQGASWRFTSNGLLAGPAFSAGGSVAIGDENLYPLDDATLHHYVGIARAGVGLKLYRDGVLISEAPGNPNISNSPARLFIGGNPQAASENFLTWEGLIDDVGVWSRPLTPTEISQLWNNGNGVSIAEAVNPTDSDGDAIPDYYENTNGLNPDDPADASQGASDGLFDNDGLTNLQEFERGTDPNNPDSDGDGLNDGPEVSGALNPFGSAPTNPLLADSDSDGLNDGVEINGTLNSFGNAPTDPNNPDTDGDGATDQQEIGFRFDPNDPNSSPPPLQRGLKGFWTFNDTLADGSGQGFDGVMLGTNPAPRYVGGKLGRAILLDGRSGVNQSVQITNSGSAFDSPGGSITISSWVRLSTAPNAGPHIVGKGAGSNWRLTLEPVSNTLIYSGGADSITGGPSIAGPVWHHAVAISEAGVATRLYLDGLLVAVGGVPTLGSSGLPMEIGGNPEIFDMNWSGLVDEVAVWNRPLDAAEVRRLWNAGQGAAVANLIIGLDTDGDGMGDVYETAHGLDPNVNDAGLDADGDGLTNLEEYEQGSDPHLADTDGDGLNDGAEAAAGTNPLGGDTDGDGLSDGQEVSGSQNRFLNNIRRDPFDPATDPPGDPTNPLSSDSDGDAWLDANEILCKTDPNDPTNFCPFPVPIAYWDFDAPFNAFAPQVTVTRTTSGNPAPLRLTLRNNAAQTPDTGGRSGDPGDHGLDLGGHNDGSSAKTAIGAHFDAISASSTYTVTWWQFNRQIANTSSFWIHAPASPGNQRGIQGHASWGDGVIYFDQSGCCNADQRLTVAAGRIILNRWQHFALVRDPVANKRLIYVDGVLLASASAGEALEPLNGIITIGAEGPSDANSFNGIVDEFAIFGDALAPEEIAALADGSINPLGERPGVISANVRITSLAFNGVPVVVSVVGMDPAASYILRRSQDGVNFTAVGAPFTGGATHTFTDPNPPAGLALYQIWTTN